MYWPSFNGALEHEGAQFRSIVNTFISISCSVVGAISFSRLLEKGKLDPEVVLNATLAGGVAMGAACDMIEEVYPSILVGFLTGAISAYGFLRLAPMLKEKIFLSDTCGVL